MKLVKALIWPVITYGAEGWTLKKDDERRLETAGMCGDTEEWCRYVGRRKRQTIAYLMNYIM